MVTWPNFSTQTKGFFPAEGVANNYQIVTSVNAGSLTVTIKDYNGNDFSPQSPLTIRIGNSVRNVTSPLSVTVNAGSNWGNAWSNELATKEIDYFVYLMYYTTASLWPKVDIAFSRIPYWVTFNDFSSSWIDSKTLHYNFDTYLPASTDKVVNIGRFNSTMSAGTWYTWSIPWTSVIVNRPIYETRRLEYTPTLTWTGVAAPTDWTNLDYFYQIVNNRLYINWSWYNMTAGTSVTGLSATLPIQASSGSPSNIALIHANVWIWFSMNPSLWTINFFSPDLHIETTSINATAFWFDWVYFI